MNINNLFIPQAKLAIEPKWGLNLLSEYLNELAAVQSGVPFKSLGISDRRKNSNVSVLEVSGANGVHSKDRFALINIEGMIKAESGMSSIGTRQMGDQLLALRNSTKGALLRINSGGGHMDGAEAMVAALREYSNKGEKPIVSLGGFMASAAYMIASESDQIFAETEFSEFGSIGVYIELNMKLIEEYKSHVQSIYAETSPDKNSAFRQLLEGDVSGFIKSANEADDYFMKLVSRNRRLSDYSTRQSTLSGGVFYMKESQERGLIDGKKTQAEAISIIQKLAA